MFPHDSGLLQWARSLALEQLRAEALRRRAPQPEVFRHPAGADFFFGFGQTRFLFSPFLALLPSPRSES